ncbi:FUSC family protein [Streptomyces sp. NPDC048641]|uniref:FUSC family protein n=1 Tax=Streptomyces sp. NPDC048641 TaxID=3154825 RepID=UPI003449C388
MSWFRALKDTTRSGLSVERQRLEPLVALRGAAGLAIVITVSLTFFGPAVAASSAFGAFQAAIATFQRSWRPRPELAVASGASLGVSTFLGYLTGGHLVAFLALLVLWTFLAGLSWAAGPTIGIIASSNVAMMLVTITLPTSVAAAAGHAAMMVFGGLVQAALVILFPVRRWGAHRDALADALAAEADYARRLRHDPVAPFDGEPLMLARNAAALTPRQARTRPAQLHGTRGLAERIRPVLASLADPAVGVPDEGPERERVRELLGAAGSILDAAARAIRHGAPVKVPPAAVATFKTPDTGVILSGPAKRAAARLGSLLRDVLETAGAHPDTQHPDTQHPETLETPDTQHPEPLNENAQLTSPALTHPTVTRPTVTSPALARPALTRPTLARLLPIAAGAMRKEVHPGSPILRHAIRVSAVAAVGYLIGTALPFGHSYWAPMAAVMVMRPDFSQTYSRAVARFAGTLIGVALATGLVQVAHPGTGLSAALAVVCAGLMYLVMRTGQLAAQACIAAYVVFLLGMGGEAWGQTVLERVVLTLVGGLLAMLAYALYPAWETPRLRTWLADWLLALGRYGAAVIGRYAEPDGGNLPDVREALLAARTAELAWQEAASRAWTEPVRHRGLSRAAADDAEHALQHIGRVEMLMEAHLPEREATPVPAAARLAKALSTATEDGARAVRERRVPNWQAVRDALADWDGEGVPDRVVRRGAGLLLEALEELSDALDTDVPPITLKPDDPPAPGGRDVDDRKSGDPPAPGGRDVDDRKSGDPPAPDGRDVDDRKSDDPPAPEDRDLDDRNLGDRKPEGPPGPEDRAAR